jgi:flavin reductase (DIM6/NTAB) family NADH-FMN oxidoreductase RutF
MYLSNKQIKELDRKKRLNLINSITGIKPANLIGSINKNNDTNLAIFSSVIHLGSFPPLIGFIVRPSATVRRHTYENILDNKKYTINHINSSIIKKAHYTSAKFESSESEFEKCKLTEEYIEDFEAPFVKESSLKMGLILKEVIPIKSNDTILIIGEVEHLFLPEKAMNKEGYLDLETNNTVGISGLNTYYNLKKIESFPYARVQEIPDFK